MFAFKTNVFLLKCPRGHGIPRSYRCFDFAIWWLRSIAFPYAFGVLYVNYLYSIVKYLCAPKMGFSADTAIDIFICISLDISLDPEN